MKAKDDMVAEIARLRALDVAQLTAEYARLFGKAPRMKNKEALWKRCAWRAQEQRCGGLSTSAKTKLEELIAQIALPTAEQQRSVAGVLTSTRSGTLSVGTTLTRTWHGRTIEVRVLENGFEHGGVVYKSLSAVARKVTNAHWNGKLFFGLVARRKEKEK